MKIDVNLYHECTITIIDIASHLLVVITMLSMLYYCNTDFCICITTGQFYQDNNCINGTGLVIITINNVYVITIDSINNVCDDAIIIIIDTL